MSATTLRRAATEIRADWSGSPAAGGESTHRFHLAVASWLDRAADFWEHPAIAAQGRPYDRDIALSAARAYLGEES